MFFVVADLLGCFWWGKVDGKVTRVVGKWFWACAMEFVDWAGNSSQLSRIKERFEHICGCEVWDELNGCLCGPSTDLIMFHLKEIPMWHSSLDEIFFSPLFFRPKNVICWLLYRLGDVLLFTFTLALCALWDDAKCGLCCSLNPKTPIRFARLSCKYFWGVELRLQIELGSRNRWHMTHDTYFLFERKRCWKKTWEAPLRSIDYVSFGRCWLALSLPPHTLYALCDVRSPFIELQLWV